MTMAATILPRAIACDQPLGSEHKPCARAIVNGIAMAVPLWVLVIWGVRALF